MRAWDRRCTLLIRSALISGTRRNLCQNQSSTRPTRVANLLENPPSGSTSSYVTVNGFVRTVRKQKQVAFASIGDGSSVEPLQAVLKPEQAERLSTGSAVVVRGKWVRSPLGKEQTSELQVEEVELQGDNDSSSNPIQKKYQTPEFLRNFPHLRVRLPHNALLLRLRSQLIANATSFFSEHDFVQAHTPIITSSDCEGAGEVFTVLSDSPQYAINSKVGVQDFDPEPFFGSPKYLTVSSQLHLEALAQSVGKVWTLSPTFRAEKSDTSRHLSEFYMLEAEIAFTTNLHDVMDVVENLIRHLTLKLKESKVGQELAEIQPAVQDVVGPSPSPASNTNLRKRWESLLNGPWTRMTYHEAFAKLRDAEIDGQADFSVPLDEENGLQTEHERFIAEKLCEGPVFVTDYPRDIKPFYMAGSDESSREGETKPTASCFDLLLPAVCEVVGGSMREHRASRLEEAMRQRDLLPVAHKLPKSSPSRNGTISDDEPSERSLDWYLDLRRYGSVPHGGFGLGFDRLLGFLSGVENIRDVVTFPRYHRRALC